VGPKVISTTDDRDYVERLRTCRHDQRRRNASTSLLEGAARLRSRPGPRRLGTRADDPSIGVRLRSRTRRR